MNQLLAGAIHTAANQLEVVSTGLHALAEGERLADHANPTACLTLLRCAVNSLEQIISSCGEELEQERRSAQLEEKKRISTKNQTI